MLWYGAAEILPVDISNRQNRKQWKKFKDLLTLVPLLLISSYLFYIPKLITLSLEQSLSDLVNILNNPRHLQ